MNMIKKTLNTWWKTYGMRPLAVWTCAVAICGAAAIAGCRRMIPLPRPLASCACRNAAAVSGLTWTAAALATINYEKKLVPLICRTVTFNWMLTHTLLIRAFHYVSTGYIMQHIISWQIRLKMSTSLFMIKWKKKIISNMNFLRRKYSF